MFAVNVDADDPDTRLLRSIATASFAGTVTAARLPDTLTVGPVHAPPDSEPWMMSQYVPSGRPVVKVRVCADDSLSSEIQASGPRENAIRFVPSVYQLATGSLFASARLCQPTMFATPVSRSVQYQPLEQLVPVT